MARDGKSAKSEKFQAKIGAFPEAQSASEKQKEHWKKAKSKNVFLDLAALLVLSFGPYPFCLKKRKVSSEKSKILEIKQQNPKVEGKSVKQKAKFHFSRSVKLKSESVIKPLSISDWHKMGRKMVIFAGKSFL